MSAWSGARLLLLAVSLQAGCRLVAGYGHVDAPMDAGFADAGVADNGFAEASTGEGGACDGAPDGARPDGAQPDGAQPDGAQPDGAQPDGAQPDGAQPLGAGQISASTSQAYAAGDSRAPFGVMSVTADFTNISGRSLAAVYFIVTQLGNGGLLLNGDGPPAGVGARLTMDPSALGPAGIWLDGAVVRQTFEIGLQAPGAFSFYVQPYGSFGP